MQGPRRALFRRIATRYDKTDTTFAAAIYLGAAFLALK
jgi:hypothetical protein